MSTRKNDFFEIETKAVEELEKAIAAELDLPDPSPEEAKAILNGRTDDEDDPESS